MYEDRLVISETDEDTLFLAGIFPKSVEEHENDCLEINDVNSHWLVCNKNKEDLKKLECAIKKLLG